MYLLGPILITLASAIILGLTYVFFRVILPMLAGTNWVHTTDDWNSYWEDGGHGGVKEDEGQTKDVSAPISLFSSTFLALSTPTGMLHTLVVVFFLVNILYNYYLCVMTSNSGPQYGIVVRELAEVTGFDYPETEEELVLCKRDFERKIYEKVQRKRDEMMRAAAASRNANAATAAASSNGAGASPNATQATSTRNNGDVESQTVSSQQSPLMATTSTTTNPPTTRPATSNAPQKLPRIHNWQLLSPIEWGYCRYSSQPKPPRSHYDHVTKGLILNMDHYCPWMFNCIGYFNYRYFFNFLWFVTIALSYGAVIIFPAFMKLGGKEYRDQVRASGGFQGKPMKDLVVKHIRSNPWIPTPNERTPVAMGCMMCLCLALAVLCLGGFHLYLALSAQSTIEFHGNFAKRRKGGWKNPYSAGSWKKNWEMIYGTRYWSSHRNTDGSSCSNSEDEEQYRYRGCWGIFMAMMPSNREPEFLPLPINGVLVRRMNRDTYYEDMDKKVDLEMGSSEITLTTSSTEETEFLMEPKDTNGRLVGRVGRSNKASQERIV